MLIIIAGSLGVGKTTLAKELCRRIKGEYLSIDKVLRDYGLDKMPQGSSCIPLKHFLQANQLLLPKIKRMIAKKKTVVVDGCFYHRKALEDLLHCSSNPHEVFTLKAPLTVCIERDQNRARSLGKEATRAVYHLTSKLELGTLLDATKPIQVNIGQIMQVIKAHRSPYLDKP